MLGPLLLLDLLAGLKVAQALRACCAMFIYILLCLCIYIHTDSLQYVPKCSVGWELFLFSYAGQ